MRPFWRVRWFLAVVRHGIEVLRGQHDMDSSEHKLRQLAVRYGVNWDRFEE